ncbi:transaldolase [Alcaligenes faecalis]|uniref:transaldolase n=1 Tax=Alcaligenes faecalis TaxID=511 RepID=UPI000A2E5C71|nr:transaldolase [Alcaligenes faecalis]OSZ42506.1 transaldolase [Alcaligenes faecalis]OSZ52194.1 transaldolase [Alcaligenes faecalis]OSZ54518.1 transaldolase [Alcaligenes faecalis]
MTTQLDSLRQCTTVVADTGDFEAMRAYRPTDATTNPSLILKAVQQAAYRPLLDRVIADHPHASLTETSDLLLVAFGRQILDIVPGRVSTEVDARLSFDTLASVERARHIIQHYEKAGITRERVLIKLASTWEGIQAARTLQAEGINCNLTLLFCLPQAIACAQAKVTLISPFVGRIYDWFKKAAGQDWDESANQGENDPGVRSVRSIYEYYKTYDIPTEIMGASFRNVGQIKALAGCDLLTISPDLLGQLDAAQGEVPAMLDVARAKAVAPEWRASNEITFRTDLNQDAMATEKLAEGIRQFTADGIKLDALIQQARQQA